MRRSGLSWMTALDHLPTSEESAKVQSKIMKAVDNQPLSAMIEVKLTRAEEVLVDLAIKASAEERA